MKTTRDLLTNIVIGDKEFEVEVNYHYYAGCHGCRDAYGQPLEPDDEPEVEIISVLDLNDKTDLLECLSDPQIERLIEKALEHEADRYYQD